MRKDQIAHAIVVLSEHLERVDWIIVGSQAIHGSHPNPPSNAVASSVDVDSIPRGYEEWMYWSIIEDLGSDSPFEEKHNFYIEIVRPTLPRLPEGWEDRAIHECIGTALIKGTRRKVNVTFPEAHDLVASKIVLARQRDIEFLQEMVDCNYISQTVLEERIKTTPIRKPKHQKGVDFALEATLEAFKNKAPHPPRLTTVGELCDESGIPAPNTTPRIVNLVYSRGHRSTLTIENPRGGYFVDVSSLNASLSEKETAMEILEVLATTLNCVEAKYALGYLAIPENQVESNDQDNEDERKPDSHSGGR